jgi:hypothetical protein
VSQELAHCWKLCLKKLAHIAGTCVSRISTLLETVTREK